MFPNEVERRVMIALQVFVVRHNGRYKVCQRTAKGAKYVGKLALGCENKFNTLKEAEFAAVRAYDSLKKRRERRNGKFNF